VERIQEHDHLIVLQNGVAAGEARPNATGRPIFASERDVQVAGIASEIGGGRLAGVVAVVGFALAEFSNGHRISDAI
jgi:hypothetical protein